MSEGNVLFSQNVCSDRRVFAFSDAENLEPQVTDFGFPMEATRPVWAKFDHSAIDIHLWLTLFSIPAAASQFGFDHVEKETRLGSLAWQQIALRHIEMPFG